MTNTMQKFIDDITDAMSQVSSIKSSDYLVAYDAYKTLYDRYVNLDESEFADYRFYNLHLRNISPEYSIADDLTLSMLSSAHPDYTTDGFPLIVISLMTLRDIVYSIATNQQ